LYLTSDISLTANLKPISPTSFNVQFWELTN
jgi:hypothetical protein